MNIMVGSNNNSAMSANGVNNQVNGRKFATRDADPNSDWTKSFTLSQMMYGLSRMVDGLTFNITGIRLRRAADDYDADGKPLYFTDEELRLSNKRPRFFCVLVTDIVKTNVAEDEVWIWPSQFSVVADNPDSVSFGKLAPKYQDKNGVWQVSNGTFDQEFRKQLIKLQKENPNIPTLEAYDKIMNEIGNRQLRVRLSYYLRKDRAGRDYTAKRLNIDFAD